MTLTFWLNIIILDFVVAGVLQIHLFIKVKIKVTFCVSWKGFIYCSGIMMTNMKSLSVIVIIHGAKIIAKSWLQGFWQAKNYNPDGYKKKILGKCFMPPALKVRRGHLVIRVSVRLSVCPFVLNSLPLTNKEQYLKFGWWYSNQTWTVSSSMGSAHFTAITCPWGWGRVKM